MDYVYMSLGKNPIITSEFRDTGCIGNILLAPFLMPNCIAFDGVTDYEKNGKHKDLYNLYLVKCPDYILAGSDEDHFKLVNFDGRYAKGDIANAGNLGNESLPNIKGSSISGVNAYAGGAMAQTKVNVDAKLSSGSTWIQANSLFDASYGQVNSDGTTYKAHADSTYKNGAKVNPDNFTVIWQARYRIDKVATEIPCPYAVGDIYQTTSSIDPATRWEGTTWERIADGNYIQFVSEEKTSKQQLNEELPNAGGLFVSSLYGGSSGVSSITGAEGMFTKDDKVNYGPHIQVTTTAFQSYRNIFTKLSTGQLNEDGTTYKSQEDSTYKNGGKVQPKSITAYGWIRVA